MPETGCLPDLGAQVRPLVQALPPGIQPRLIAELERAAADRYRAWAAAYPDAAEAAGLRECAMREEEVARRVEVLFPSQPDEQRYFSDALPKIAEAYRVALAHRPVAEQYAIQAAAERRGAAFWRALVSSLVDARVRETLLACAELEERSADFLEALVNRTDITSAKTVRAIDRLYGTWKLVSWTRHLLDTGETVAAFGKTPRGFLNYGRDGRVFFIMAKEKRAKPADLTALTDQDRVELYNTMIAYAGTFTFDGKTATHNVDVAWNEVWTGTAQVRKLKFEGRTLVMSTNPQSGADGQRVVGVFTWEKLE